MLLIKKTSIINYIVIEDKISYIVSVTDKQNIVIHHCMILSVTYTALCTHIIHISIRPA